MLGHGESLKKHHWGRPKGKANLTAIQRSRIVGKALAGKAKTEIAREEGVNRKTVERALTRPEAQALLGAFRSAALQAAPDALEYLHRRVKQGLKAGPDEDVPGATKAAIKILEGTQVFADNVDIDVSAGAAEFGKYGYSAFSDRSDEELEYFVRKDRWPSVEELEHYRKTGTWPEEAAA